MLSFPLDSIDITAQVSLSITTKCVCDTKARAVRLMETTDADGNCEVQPAAPDLWQDDGACPPHPAAR